MFAVMYLNLNSTRENEVMMQKYGNRMHRRCNAKDQSLGLRKEMKKYMKRNVKNEGNQSEKINKKGPTSTPAPTPIPNLRFTGTHKYLPPFWLLPVNITCP